MSILLPYFDHFLKELLYFMIFVIYFIDSVNIFTILRNSESVINATYKHKNRRKNRWENSKVDAFRGKTTTRKQAFSI